MKRITITVDLFEVPAHSHDLIVAALRGPFPESDMTIGYQSLIGTKQPKLCPECKGSGYRGGVSGHHVVMGESPAICPLCAGSGRERTGG